MRTFLLTQLLITGAAVGLILFAVIRLYISLAQTLVHLLGAL